MSFYILQPDPRVPGQPSILSCPDDIAPEELLAGRPVTIPRNPLQLKMSPRSGKFRGVIISGVLTLFHDSLRERLLMLGVDGVQYFPVDLENPEGVVEKRYWLVNVLTMIDAVDKANSVIVPRAVGGRGALKSFRIDPTVARGHRIFRVPEAPTLICIDQELQVSLDSDDFNLAGAWLLPTEEYDGW